MWQPAYSQRGFVSRIVVADETEATGKWLVPVVLGDPDDVCERIVVAAASGQLPCAKLSSPRLDAILGHHLACVYSRSSSLEDAFDILGRLRKLGVQGDFSFKSCLATAQGRDDKLWESQELEEETECGPRRAFHGV